MVSPDLEAPPSLVDRAPLMSPRGQSDMCADRPGMDTGLRSIGGCPLAPNAVFQATAPDQAPIRLASAVAVCSRGPLCCRSDDQLGWQSGECRFKVSAVKITKKPGDLAC